jgi:hypothetical protein
MKTITTLLHNLPRPKSNVPAGTALLVLAAVFSADVSAGTLGANGVVTLPPSGDPTYGWVSTRGGVAGAGLSYIVPGFGMLM